MIINGTDYKINVLILFMEDEADVTIAAVETLLETIEEGVTISVLLNGGTRGDLRELFTRSPHISYHESATNLGVAGGRNFLLDRDEAKSADIIMLLDNDVITTTDYVRGLATFLISSENVGVVGSTMLKNPAVDRLLKRHAAEKKGVFGNTIRLIDNKKVRKILKGNFSKDLFYHIGSDPDWYDAYFSSKIFRERLLLQRGVIKKKTFHTSLIYNNAVSFGYLNDTNERIEVSNVGGGNQAFFTDLISDIGGLNDIFNPYGFEDVEFCIRAMRHGYKNYTDMNTFLIHDTSNKELDRNHYRSSVKNRMRNIIDIKNMTFLYHLNFPDSYKELIYRRIFYEYLSDLLAPDEDALENMYHNMLGYLKAVKEIGFKQDPAVDGNPLIYQDDYEINELAIEISRGLEKHIKRADEFEVDDLKEILKRSDFDNYVTAKLGTNREKRYFFKNLLKEAVKKTVLKFGITRRLIYTAYRKKILN